MTHGDSHGSSEHVSAGHGHAPTGGAQALLPPEEWAAFRASDKVAGTYIVILMQGIFVIGLILYLIVLWSVSA